jgi:hypothetical protein
MSMMRSAVYLLAVGLSVPASAIDRVQNPPVNPDAQVLADFKARVDKYVALRKKADDTAAPLKKTDDPADIRTAQQMLVERIGAARAGTKQGDIFTDEIAKLLKRLLRPELREQGTKEVMREDKPDKVAFKINGPYPDKEPLTTVPPNILAALPPLPKDIDYRFVNKHLILRDTRANMIIDYIPNAIP